MTLIEVIIALVMLAIGLTALFSSEVSAVKVSARAWKLNVATLLARCKMAEVEEKMLKEGFPALLDKGRDPCCEDAKVEGFRCEWKVERIVLPDLAQAGIDENGAEGAEDSAPDPLDQLTDQFQGAGAAGDPTGGISSAIGSGVGDSAMAGIAMSYAFPIFKPTIEDRVRRATVKVIWDEGDKQRDFESVQFLVSENSTGILPQGAPAEDATP